MKIINKWYQNKFCTVFQEPAYSKSIESYTFRAGKDLRIT